MIIFCVSVFLCVWPPVTLKQDCAGNGMRDQGPATGERAVNYRRSGAVEVEMSDGGPAAPEARNPGPAIRDLCLTAGDHLW